LTVFFGFMGNPLEQSELIPGEVPLYLIGKQP